MDSDISPEPSPAERKAIEQALARLAALPRDPRSGWWRAGVGESVSPEEEPA